ncbi:C2 family cysteine protease [Nitriliruptor alkaliphilus]|uniref:C2 family cysteine protease n=1 Tax=Nitriliruptor alkaliphilus TaxID=427918 RepID=UPI000695F98D|nr:C2 family cysteine protease [Nitriliruptor alkaliphilus]
METSRWRAERGQGTAEYVALLVVVAALVGLAFTQAPSITASLASTVRTGFCSIIAGACDQGPPQGTTEPVAPVDHAGDGGGSGDADRPPRDPFDDAVTTAVADDAPVVPPGSRDLADEAVVAETLERLEALLDGKVGPGDLSDIDELLGGLGNAELNAVVAALGDEQVRAWAEGMERRSGWWPPWRNDSIDDDRQRELLNGLLPGLDPENVARFVDVLDQLSPAFDDLPGSFESKDGEDGLVYERLEGAELYVDGVDVMDVHQGSIGDCHLMATLGAIAAADPGFIEDMITDNGNGTYTVRFHDDRGRVEYVTVDDRFPYNPDAGRPEFARPGHPPELWPLIIEKAYAQRYGSYGEIEGAPTDRTVQRLTGERTRTQHTSGTDLQEIAQRFDAGEPLAVRSLRTSAIDDVPEYQDRFVDASGNEIRQLVAPHAYFVSSVDEDAGTVTLRNPHGPHTADIVLTVDQMSRLFDGVVFRD